MSDMNWNSLYLHRKTIARQFGEIWNIPIARRYYNVLATLGHSSIKLLEVGAGDRGVKDKMAKYWGEYHYYSCDIDPTYPHDFSDIELVSGEYDLICAFEMIEHLSLTDAQSMIVRCFDLTKPGGQIALSTPNIFYPPAFFRDATHQTAFCYDELAGLMQLCGYEISGIYRLYHDSLLKKFIKRFLCYPLFRVLGIDFAHQIMVVGRKPA